MIKFKQIFDENSDQETAYMSIFYQIAILPKEEDRKIMIDHFVEFLDERKTKQEKFICLSCSGKCHYNEQIGEIVCATCQKVQ